MQRAIKHYIKKRARLIDKAEHSGVSFINQIFEMIDDEINEVRRVEIKRAKEDRLTEWRRKEKSNCKHNNKG